MTIKEFFGKLTGKIIWVNLLMMFLVVVAAFIAVWIALDHYTLHGQEICVPNVRGTNVNLAKEQLARNGLIPIVADSGYNKTVPAGTVLEQTPASGRHVKPGREVYLTINTTSTPTVPLPDIADNSSVREAEARLKAMGFKLRPNEEVDGEKDWVYGVKFRGRNIYGGDRIPIDAELTLQVGRGEYGAEEYDSLYDDTEVYTDSPAEEAL